MCRFACLHSIKRLVELSREHEHNHADTHEDDGMLVKERYLVRPDLEAVEYGRDREDDEKSEQQRVSFEHRFGIHARPVVYVFDHLLYVLDGVFGGHI